MDCATGPCGGQHGSRNISSSRTLVCSFPLPLTALPLVLLHVPVLACKRGSDLRLLSRHRLARGTRPCREAESRRHSMAFRRSQGRAANRADGLRVPAALAVGPSDSAWHSGRSRGPGGEGGTPGNSGCRVLRPCPIGGPVDRSSGTGTSQAAYRPCGHEIRRRDAADLESTGFSALVR